MTAETERKLTKAQVAYRAAIGDEAANEAFSAAWFALHQFAHRSGCPPGRDVLAWFQARAEAALKAQALTQGGGDAG